jgi:uncharacterized protein YjbI with pentapeptide repeats
MIGILVTAVVVAVGWALFVPIADWLATHDVGSVTGPVRALRLQTAIDAARGRLLTFGAGVFAAGALVFTARNFSLSREGQVTDRYTKAIEQLGSDKLDTRIGGIYALERVARDSARDHPTVMEVLAAFIREHSHDKWTPANPGSGPLPERRTRPDVQAGLTVIGRRNSRNDREPIDISGADLSGADLSGADLSRVGLSGANLTLARLIRGDLSGADLLGANLTVADLSGANLTRARLTRANLTRARLYAANLTAANLTTANLDGANLADANLSDAKLAAADLSGAGFIHADLTDADLTDANVTYARLATANLTGAVWPERPAPPPGWEREPDSGRLKRVSENPDVTAPPEM